MASRDRDALARWLRCALETERQKRLCEEAVDLLRKTLEHPSSDLPPMLKIKIVEFLGQF
jgi:hypothetical protein